MKTQIVAIVTSMLAASPTHAAEYSCPVELKFDRDRIYTPGHLLKAQLSVRIVDDGTTSQISRCGFSSSAGKVTCDIYAVDQVAVTGRYVANNVWQEEAIKKFYNFASNFDVQLFLDTPGLPFVENNGRGTIAYGKCEKVR